MYMIQGYLYTSPSRPIPSVRSWGNNVIDLTEASASPRQAALQELKARRGGSSQAGASDTPEQVGVTQSFPAQHSLANSNRAPAPRPSAHASCISGGCQ